MGSLGARTSAVHAICLLLVAAALSTASKADAQALDIYFIDTEGGQATLYVSPSGESLLVDTGNAGARDHERIMQAIRAAGLQRLDHLWITHFHSDHHGGLEELSRAIEIGNFYDHGPSFEAGRANVDAFMERYAAITGGRRRSVKAGETIPFAGVAVAVVASGTGLLDAPIVGAPGAGEPNPFCASHVRKDLNPAEDDHSAGFVLSLGAFRTINLGDFTWDLEYDLVCPANPIGTISLYATSYHGFDRAGSPALIHALRPRVAIMNNGPRKGGAVEPLQVLRLSPGLEDIWQLHWSHAAGIEHNAAGVFVANLDTPQTLASVVDPARAGQAGGTGLADAADHTPAYWIHVRAQPDGSFTVTNTRNGFSKRYESE